MTQISLLDRDPSFNRSRRNSNSGEAHEKVKAKPGGKVKVYWELYQLIAKRRDGLTSKEIRDITGKPLNEFSGRLSECLTDKIKLFYRKPHPDPKEAAKGKWLSRDGASVLFIARVWDGSPESVIRLKAA